METDSPLQTRRLRRQHKRRILLSSSDEGEESTFGRSDEVTTRSGYSTQKNMWLLVGRRKKAQGAKW